MQPTTTTARRPRKPQPRYTGRQIILTTAQKTALARLAVESKSRHVSFGEICRDIFVHPRDVRKSFDVPTVEALLKIGAEHARTQATRAATPAPAKPAPTLWEQYRALQKSDPGLATLFYRQNQRALEA